MNGAPLPRPLAGIRVLDVSTMIAAPTAAAVLGDFGAQVYKVEQPGTGDHARHMGASKNGANLFWKSIGRNKKSVALDLHALEVQALLLRWLPRFDIMIENFRPGTLERWNLGPERLLEANPKLVLVRMTGFGQDGPYRDRAGFGTLAEAMSGFASLNGYPDRPPVLPPGALADVSSGYLAAAAALAAMHRARETGKGDVIDVAIYESVIPILENAILDYDQLGVVAQRIGNRNHNVAPRGAYRCADGEWVALSASAQSIAMRLLRAVGGDALADDPRYATNAERLRHYDDLDELLSAWFGARNRADAIDELVPLGVAVGPLESVATVLDNPQVVARESFVSVDDPDVGPLRLHNAYPRFMRSERATIQPGVTGVGADTAEVLRDELGLDDGMLSDLAQRGAIGLPREGIPPELLDPPAVVEA